MKREASPFDTLAARYDAWYDSADGRPLFEAETACLRLLKPDRLWRWLEVGVGTGRFAAALGLADGIDMSEAMLRYAALRGVRVLAADACAEPYSQGAFDGALMVATLCFLADPLPALRECHRILRDDGRLLVGIVPADSRWGRFYASKARDGHPFYSVAKFYTCEETIALASASGFAFDQAASALFERPGQTVSAPARKGLVRGAGFVALRFRKASPCS